MGSELTVHEIDEMAAILYEDLSDQDILATNIELSLERSTSNTMNPPISLENPSSIARSKRTNPDPILVADTSLNCIDLTENDDHANDIIIEKHVGRDTRNTRNLYYRDRYGAMQRRKNPNRISSYNDHDATIIIDDEKTETVPNPNPPKRISPKRAKKNTEPEKPKNTEQEVQCPICLETLEELKKNNKRLKSTLCGHILCNECLDNTFKATGLKTMNCPTCRIKLTKQKVHDLFI